MRVAKRHDVRPASSNWTYQRVEADEFLEYGTVRGRDVALPAHFHDEDQITIVLSGRRRFVLGGHLTSVETGGCVVIPAGTVHRSLIESAGVEAVNLYLPAGDYTVAAMADDLARMWREGGCREPQTLAQAVRTHRLSHRDDVSIDAARLGTVADIAARAGLSREGFSRAFVRTHGMPPHAFGMVMRLNHARRLLRRNVHIVEAAIDAGFADQSHLGRCFRRVFGVSPGHYRAG